MAASIYPSEAGMLRAVLRHIGTMHELGYPVERIAAYAARELSESDARIAAYDATNDAEFRAAIANLGQPAAAVTP